MFSAYAAMALLFFAHHVPVTNCGAGKYREVIEKTTSLILEKASMGSFVGEFPTPEGTPECARVKFSIDGEGRAIGISIPESSGNFEVDMAVVKSIKKYRFRAEMLSGYRTYMLVFKVNYNKIPPGYYNNIKNNDQIKGFEVI